MAFVQSNNVLDVTFEASRTFFHQKLEQMRVNRARRKVYKQTRSELISLNDRELADLGIPRASIRRIAMEAAYDC
ncbi:DUF1127 domain-containing protein [Planktotalea sp.]|uniref:DUF1127 domain-containing protein n=1 Tax=Planktotalea sp. TaxID=2029877 RepID=UPI003299CBE3